MDRNDELKALSQQDDVDSRSVGSFFDQIGFTGEAGGFWVWLKTRLRIENRKRQPGDQFRANLHHPMRTSEHRINREADPLPVLYRREVTSVEQKLVRQNIDLKQQLDIVRKQRSTLYKGIRFIAQKAATGYYPDPQHPFHWTVPHENYSTEQGNQIREMMGTVEALREAWEEMEAASAGIAIPGPRIAPE